MQCETSGRQRHQLFIFLPVHANDPLHFHPRPNELVSKLEDEDASTGVEEDDDFGGDTRQQLYVPPRVVAVPYAEDKGETQKLNRKRTRGSVLQELKDELSEAPLELKVIGILIVHTSIVIVVFNN